MLQVHAAVFGPQKNQSNLGFLFLSSILATEACCGGIASLSLKKDEAGKAQAKDEEKELITKNKK